MQQLLALEEPHQRAVFCLQRLNGYRGYQSPSVSMVCTSPPTSLSSVMMTSSSPKLSTPPLTTIAQPMAAIAQNAMGLLLQQINSKSAATGEGTAPQQIILQPQIGHSAIDGSKGSYPNVPPTLS